MSLLERIQMLKKMVKEAERIVTWQGDIYTALHNIHADWIVNGTIAWSRVVANFPRTIAELLSDHNLAHHGLGTIVPHDALASLTERAHGSLTGVTSDQHHPQAHTLASHSTKAHTELTGVTSDQHHARYTNAEAIAAGKTDPALLNPSGIVSIWTGLIANIPSGWVICDGNNGTKNLLARFIEGVATAATNPGATGGATAKTTAGHTHAFTSAEPRFVLGAGTGTAPPILSNTDSISDIRPLYYDVAFLMKI